MFTFRVASRLSLVAASLASFVSLGAATALATPPVDEIPALKAQIVALARENTFDADTELAETRAKLQPLVDRLVALGGDEDVYTQLRKVEGAWHELWSDDREPPKPGAQLRRDTVYQVVTPAGFFYNVGTSQGATPGGQTITYTSFLRGIYTLAPTRKGFDIEFNRIGYVDGFLAPTTKLVDAIYTAETDATFLKAFPFDLRVPRGPIGARGFLSNVYVDDTLRIATGFNQADGKQDLYVLEKVETPVVFE